MKTIPQITAADAARMIERGNTVVLGGFGMTGAPVHLLDALVQCGTGDLTIISNNIGEPGLGASRLLRKGQIRKAMGSYFTTNPEAVAAAQSGAIEVELIPQGSLAEALRAGGAGIGGFFTPTAAGTRLAENRETRVFDGITHVFQPALKADVALIRAWRADTAGNLVYRLTENNFNQAAAMAATRVIAEVEQIVPLGELDPNHIHTPGCYVDYLVEAQLGEDELGSSASVAGSLKKVDHARLRMARAALDELCPGDVVNLGIGIPTLVADLLQPEHGVTLHSENGMLGLGPEPPTGGAMEYPVNAGKIPVTALPGSSYFDSAESFAIIRGGHVDVAIMGGLQVDAVGNLANWAVPGKPLLGVGGAMDLAAGAKRLVITMTHTTNDGSSKVVPECTLPLTAAKVVDVLITDIAKFRFIQGQLTLVGLIGGSTLDEVAARTDAKYAVALEV